MLVNARRLASPLPSTPTDTFSLVEGVLHTSARFAQERSSELSVIIIPLETQSTVIITCQTREPSPQSFVPPIAKVLPRQRPDRNCRLAQSGQPKRSPDLALARSSPSSACQSDRRDLALPHLIHALPRSVLVPTPLPVAYKLDIFRGNICKQLAAQLAK